MQEAPAGQVGSGYTWLGPAPGACQVPLRHPSGLAGPYLSNPFFSRDLPQAPSHFHVSIHKAVSSARRTFLLGKLFLLLQARPKLLGISPWVLREFVGILLPGLAQDIALCRNKAGRLPGAWAQLVATLLLLTVGFSLAVRQLCSSGASPGALGAGAPPASGHSHRPGVYHHGAIISPAGQC